MQAIPKAEYEGRIKKFQANIRKAGLDAALVHSNEADFANVRYLTEYWPTFESAGVFVPAKGSPVLIIGPESEAYAQGRSILKRIAMMVEYRESADPEYPGIPVAHFSDVARTAMRGRPLKKLGLVGFSIMPLPVYFGLQRELPGVELVKADEATGMVSVRLQGACRGCPGAAMTLKMGVERLLKEKVPTVKGVIAVQ